MNLKQPSTLNREHLATQPFSNCMYIIINYCIIIYFIIYCMVKNPQACAHNVKESCMVYIWLCELIIIICYIVNEL